MLVIPEKKLVIITPPRCGSTALRDAVLKNFPKAKSLYRHMEAQGLPEGYENYSFILMIRNPFERMWSLYKYMAITDSGTEEWRRRQHEQAARPFEEWLLDPQGVVFAAGALYGGDNPYYHMIRYTPEPLKSLYSYIHGADSTTKNYSVMRMETGAIYKLLEIEPHTSNGTNKEPMPELSKEAMERLSWRWEWELKFYQ